MNFYTPSAHFLSRDNVLAVVFPLFERAVKQELQVFRLTWVGKSIPKWDIRSTVTAKKYNQDTAFNLAVYRKEAQMKHNAIQNMHLWIDAPIV